MDLIYKEFNELTNSELYEILKSRATIFIMEQNVKYQDLDDIDYESLHCFYKENNKVIAYLRVFYEDRKKNIIRIGRVLTLNHGQGIGKKLMSESLSIIIKKYHPSKICMDAQVHAIYFYKQFGFKVTSKEFIEDEIPHVKMCYIPETTDK